ncbi:MAG: phage tail length tape measure family protein [Mesorhizobium sp.]
MVQQISALIVQPAVDASKYTAGAQEKVTADKAMAASSREAGAAAVDTSAKINVSGDVLARLSRQFVDGYANEQRFAQGLNQLSRGLDSGKISMEGAERILIGMNQRLGLTADVTQVAAKGQMALASAVERANAQIARQAAELANADTVNRRFNAANSNVISAGQRQAAGFNAGQQLQDIGMMALTGQNVGVLALQQGPQLATAIQQGGGLGTVVSGLGSLLSLTTLLTIGFTAAGAAAIQWFVKGREGAKSLEEKLKDHSATLSRLKQQYGELGDASKNVGGPVGGITYTEAQARGDVDTLRAAIRSQSGDLSKEFIGGGFLRGGLFGSNTGGLDTLLSTRGSPFQSVVDDLLKSVRDGNGGLEKFDANLNKVFDDLRGKSNDPAKLAEEMQRLSDAALDAFSVTGKMSPFQSEIDRLLLGLKEGNSDLSSFATNVRRIGELNGIGKQADDAILAAKEVVNLAEKLKEVEQILRRIDHENTRPGLRDQRELRRYVAGRDADARTLDQQFAADQQLARARTNAERLAAVEAQVRARVREDGDSGGGLQARVNRALTEERTRQEVEARDAAIQRSQAIERSLQQQRLELDLIGKTGGEQAKLRYEFERMQELREQAARTGEPIDRKEVENIKAAAEAMGRYADALARAQLGDELSFERSQFFRSPLDQQIASRQRSAGLPIDMGSPEAMQMRQLDRMERVYERGMSFWDDFENGIKRGDDFGKALGDAIRNAVIEELTDVARNAFSNFLKEGIRVLMPGAGGGSSGSLGGSIVGSILGGANDNYAAPAGAVMRMPLPAIGSGSGYSVANATSFIQQYAASIGIDPATALKVARSEGLGAGIWQSNYVKGGFREPSFGPFQLLKGGAGTGFGTGLGNAFQRQTGLDPADPANWQQSTAFALDQAKANGWGAWFGAQKQGITGFMGIDRNVSKASQALDKLATSSVDTAKTLEGGLGKLGSSLGQFPAAPSGGAGGLLGSLFGGLNSAFSGSKAYSWLSANPGNYIGLFDSGGSILNGNVVPFGPKTRSLGNGVFADSGFGPGHFPAILEETESVLTRDMMGRTMRALRGVANQNSGGGGSAPSGIADVRVFVDQDGNWQAKVEKISQGPARQESNRAVGNYAYQQSNGGAKADDHRYQRLKRRV